MKQLKKIDDYQFPSYIEAQLPFTSSEYHLVTLALKEFFKAWVISGYKSVSMTSYAADMLWHEMILNTHEYETFCKKTLGKFLHHTTNSARTISKKTELIEMRKTIECCARASNQDPLDPTPTKLFALDRELSLWDKGFIWVRYEYERTAILTQHPKANVHAVEYYLK